MDDPPGEARDAFEILSNETRLAIIRTLGDEGGPEGFETLTFSTLQERVGVEDSGGFSYHLDRLVGRFVERTASGYELTPPGIRVYQLIVSGQFAPSPDIPEMEIESECWRCGVSDVAWYEDHRFHVGCPECDHVFVRYPLGPGAFDVERPETLVTAGSTRLQQDHTWMAKGGCPYCAGSVERSVTPDSRGLENPDSTTGEATAHFTCSSCHWYLHADISIPIQYQPPSVSFCYEHGRNPYDVHPWDLVCDMDEEVLSTDPCEAAVTLAIDDDERRIVVDESFDVVEVTDG